MPLAKNCTTNSHGFLLISLRIGKWSTIKGEKAVDMGLIMGAVDTAVLDETVDGLVDIFKHYAQEATSQPKLAINIGHRNLATSILDASLALEGLKMRSADHRESLQAFVEDRKPSFGG